MAVKENKKEESLRKENVKNTKKVSKDNSKAKKNVAKPAKKESWFKKLFKRKDKNLFKFSNYAKKNGH